MAIDDKDTQRPGSREFEGVQVPGSPLGGNEFSLWQRLGVGLNVTLMVAAAAILLVGVNLLVHLRWFQARTDVSSMGRYSLSESTRRIVGEIDKPIQITVIYDSDEPDKARDDYHPRLWDLVEEIELAGSNVKITDIARPAQRRDFAVAVQKKIGPSAAPWGRLIEEFTKTDRPVLAQELSAARQDMLPLIGAQGVWLANFNQLVAAQNALGQTADDLQKAADEVTEMGSGTLSPYGRQVDRIKQWVNSADGELDTIHTDMVELKELAAKLRAGDGGLAEGSQANVARVKKAFAELTLLLEKTAARPATAPEQDKVADVYRDVSRLLREIADAMEAQGTLLTAFAVDQPAVQGHHDWVVRVPLNEFMEQRLPLADMFTGFAQALRQVAAENDRQAESTRPERLREQLPQMQAAFAQQMQMTEQEVLGRMTQFLDNLRGVDAASEALLAGAEKFLEGPRKTVDAYKKRIEDLPELKFGELADQLKDDNLVLIEVGEGADADRRVLGFNDIWPEMPTMEPPASDEPTERKKRRSFNGDAAIGGALLSMTSRPFAEVVFVHFTGAMPQQNPMMMRQGPQEGDVPLSQLTELQERLKAANLEVAEWNLAESMMPPPPSYGDKKKDAEADDSEGEASPPPAEQGDPLPRVYVVLPPPEPNPMMGRQGGPQFGPQHAMAVADEIDHGGKAIFLTTFAEPRPGPFGGITSPSYAWNDYLGESWGLKVRQDYRIIQGVPTREPNRVGLSGELWNYMPLNSFADHPIGKPLQGRRVLMVNVSPIMQTDKKPDGVKYADVLEVPSSSRSIWATDDIFNVINQLETAVESKVTIDREKALPLPYDVVVAATRKPIKEGVSEPSRLVLFSGGISLTDSYMTSPVIRGGAEGVEFAPPPRVNAEIAINSVYWLAGKEDRIASGPVAMPTIEPIPPVRLNILKLLAVTAMPVLVLLIGLAVAALRRSS